MGAYAQLYFDSKIMLSVKNGVPGDILSMFSDSERKVLSKEDFKIAFPYKDLDEETEDLSVFPEFVNFYYIYQTNASYIRDRLDLMGINLKNLREIFDEGIKEYKIYKDGIEHSPEISDFWESHDAKNEIQDDVGDYTFDYWLTMVKQAVDSKTSLSDIDSKNFYFLQSETFNWFSDQYGFPSYYLDLRYLFRVLLEFVPDTNIITLDYSDLVWSEYEDENALLCQDATDLSAHDYSINEKVILLTEGSSDITYLERSLTLLYPHVASSFSFADFSAVKYQGGVASIVTSLKVLISMSIKNRVIAIFDSDSAAVDALRALKDITLPANIKFMRLPEIDFARNYPSVGPTGNSNLNINGLACSTELYLPKEILRDKNGHYFPVHWTGYIQSIGLYQGEISNKREIMNRFLGLIKSIEKGDARLEDYSWENMQSIFKAIFAELAS